MLLTISVIQAEIPKGDELRMAVFDVIAHYNAFSTLPKPRNPPVSSRTCARMA